MLLEVGAVMWEVGDWHRRRVIRSAKVYKVSASKGCAVLHEVAK